jgi:hypothetical protein
VVAVRDDIEPRVDARVGWRRWRRRPSPRLVGWFVFAGVLALTLIRNSYVFTAKIYEDGDFALNSFLVNHTHAGLQLVGVDSRIGFSHPGPAYIYVISAGQTVFHDLLHIVPSQYGGQFVGDSILQAAMLAMIVKSILRVTGSLVAAVLATSIVFAFAATHEMIGYVWLPCMYMSAFALLLAAGAAVAAGYTSELALLVVACGLLIHGHVAFIVFVTVTVVAVLAGWWYRYRGGWRAELAAHRRTVRWSVALVAVFTAPLVLEVVLHYPGPWPAYVRYSLRQGGSPHSLADSVRYLGYFWSYVRIPIAVFVIAGVVALAMLVLDRDRRRRTYFAWGYGLLALETALFLYYISHGIDVLDASNYYTGYFYETVPLFLVVFASVHAGLVAHARLGAAKPSWCRYAVPALTIVVAAGLIVTRATAPGFTDLYRGKTEFPQVVSALAHDRDRAGRPVVVDFVHADWGAVAGVMIQADRSGLTACLQDPTWTLPFTPAEICSTTADHWRVSILPRSTWNKQGTVVWSNATLVVVEGAPPVTGSTS